MRNLRIVCIGLLVLLWLGCGGEPRTLSYSVKGQTFELMGPLFAGPNTGQATFSPDLSATLQGADATTDDLVDVKLSQATLRMPPGQTFEGINEIVLNLVADEADMIQAAVLNPVPQDRSEVSLTVSDEAELLKIFQQSKAYFVVDLGLANDMDTSVVVMGDFTFDVLVD